MTESTTQPILKPKPFFSRGFGRKTGSFKWFFLTILLVGPFFIFLSGALGHHAALSPIHLNPGEISFQPEMERDLEDCVIGLNPDQERRYLLPDLEIPGRLPEAQYQVIRRQLFWLDFELCHGKLLMSL